MLRTFIVFMTLLAAAPAAAETLTVTRGSESLDIELWPARKIFAADYSERVAGAGGLVETPRDTWANRPTCRYLVGDGAAFRECEGVWQGVYRDASGYFELRPDLTLHRTVSSGSCGVDGAAADAPALPVLPPREPFSTALEAPDFLEVTLVTDARLAELTQAGQNVPDPALSYFAASVLFDGTEFSRRLLPLLVGVVAYDSSTPWGRPSFEPVRSGGYLDDFNDWLRGAPAEVVNRDVVVLLSGWDFWGSTVGLANVSGACDLGLNGALVYGEGPLPSVAQTLAHELGHTIGMWHDSSGNTCPRDGFVMQAVYSEDGPYPTDFSTCSIASADEFLASASARCIGVDAAPTFPQATCGDGRVEGDETCDCGPDGCAGRNPCCDEQTCQLAPGALCAGTDGCCNLDTCEPRAASEGFVCREARGACDVAEVCTGGAACPDDRVAPTGGTCDADGWSGACYLGECVTRGGQCDAVFDLYFFDTPPYDAMCGGAEAGCQVLECMANRACVLTEEVPFDGTECGPGSQCSNGTCQASGALASPECLDETDRDGDGVDACGDDADLCPTDPLKTDPGFCGCLRPETCPEAMNAEEPDAGGSADAGDQSDDGTGGTGGAGGTGGTGGGSPGGDVVVGASSNSDGGCSSSGASSGSGPLGSPFGLLVLLLGLGIVRRAKRKDLN